jgi:hypothetical protein
MKYYGKKLPNGFIYMLNKKDAVEINEQNNHCINWVYLDGTSYSETKMSKNWIKSKIVARVGSEINELGFFVHIRLYGIKCSYFKHKEHFLLKKEEVKLDLMKKIKENLAAHTKNEPIKEKYFFIDVSVEE